MQNLLPEYFRLLAEAQSAAEVVDNFDLDHNNKEEFRNLQQRQLEHSACLIVYLHKNGIEVVLQLSQLFHTNL